MDESIFISSSTSGRGELIEKIIANLRNDKFNVESGQEKFDLSKYTLFIVFLTDDYVTTASSEFELINNSDKKCVYVVLEKLSRDVVNSYSVYLHGDSRILNAVGYPASEQLYARLKKALVGGFESDCCHIERENYFTGREDVIDVMSKNKRVCLHGVSGVGKTSAVTEYIHRHQERRLFWFDADLGLKVQRMVLKYASRISGETIGDTEKAFQVFIEHVNRQDDVLVVFDDVSDISHVAKLIKAISSKVKIVLTTKLEDVKGFEMVKVKPFDAAESKEYLKIALSDLDEQSIDTIVKQKPDFLPFELSLIAGILNNGSKLTIDDCMESSGNLVECVLKRLDEDALRILQRVTLLDADHVPEYFLRRFEEKSFKQVLQKITSCQLCKIVFPNTPHFGIRVHRLVQNELAKNFDNEQVRAEMVSTLDTIFPATTQHSTKEWQQANEHSHHVIKLLSTIDRSTPTTINLRSKLAEYFINTLQDYKSGLAIHIEVLETARKVFKAKHPILAKSLDNVAATYNRLGDDKKYLKYALEALEIKKSLDTEVSDIADTMNNIAESYGRLGESDKALEYKLQSLGMRRKVHKNDHADIAKSLYDIALYHGRLGHANKSLEFFSQALQMRKRLCKSEESAEIANTLGCIATAYSELGDDHASLGYMLQSLDMRKRLYADPHPEIAEALNSVGMAFSRLDDHQKSLEYKLKALEMRKRCFKDDHADVAESLQHLGISFGLLDHNEKALEFLLESLEMRKKLLKDADDAKIADNLSHIANAFAIIDDNKKSLDYHIQAFEMRKRLYKGDHPDVIKSMQAISKINATLNDYNTSDSDSDSDE